MSKKPLSTQAQMDRLALLYLRMVARRLNASSTVHTTKYTEADLAWFRKPIGAYTPRIERKPIVIPTELYVLAFVALVMAVCVGVCS